MKKTIFITGASTGLGNASAHLFQSKGWNVIATMRHPELDTTLKNLENVHLLEMDVTDPEQIIRTVKHVIENHSVDVVLNNAGYGLLGPLEALEDEQIVRQVNTNLLGVIRVTKAFASYFRERRNGLFLNITSMFGLMGYATCSVYSATKFAVDGFSESLAYDLAHFDVGVKIIAPGGIQTDFAGRSLDIGMHKDYQGLIDIVALGYSPEKVSQYAKAIDIASVIYEAATDNKTQLRYLAGTDAISLYDERLKIGAEAQCHSLRATFSY